jgi:hypothetical protein
MLRGILAHTHAPVKKFITPIDKTYCVSMDVSPPYAYTDIHLYRVSRLGKVCSWASQWSPHAPFI